MFLTDAQKQWRSLAAGWQGVDWVLFALPVALTIFGAAVIYSTQQNTANAGYGLNHVFLGLISMVISLWIARSRYEYLMSWQWIIYGIVNLSLLAVMFIGTVGGGAQSWIAVGGFYVQPSEFAKLSIIITLAATLSRRDASTLWGVAGALMVLVLPWALVFIQPDLGTSLVFGAITLAMLYWANCNPGWLVLFVSPLVAAILFNLVLPGWLVWSMGMGAIAWFTLPWRWFSTVVATAVNLVSGKLGDMLWNLLQDYQKDRLVLFLDPDKDPLGGGYQLIQSRIAIGSGKIWGQGWGQGAQTQLNFIPEQHTDFIFSAVGEEWGFVGSMVVIVAYWLICFRLVVIAQNAKDDFGSLLVIGVLAMVVFQVVVNIGMTIGLAPITGIPLPWLSYGRSALLTNFIALGMVESVANFRHRLKFTD